MQRLRSGLAVCLFRSGSQRLAGVAPGDRAFGERATTHLGRTRARLGHWRV